MLATAMRFMLLFSLGKRDRRDQDHAGRKRYPMQLLHLELLTNIPSSPLHLTAAAIVALDVHRSWGPFTAVATRGVPVKLTGVAPISSVKSVPRNMLGDCRRSCVRADD